VALSRSLAGSHRTYFEALLLLPATGITTASPVCGGHCSLLLRAVAHQNSSVWSASRRGKCPSSCHSATDHIIGALYLSPWSCQCHCPLQVLLGCAFHSAASSNRILRTLSVPSVAPLLLGGGGGGAQRPVGGITGMTLWAVALAVSKALTSGHPRRSPAAWAAGAGGRRQRACGPLLSRPLPASQGYDCIVFLLVRILKPALATARHGRRNFFNLLNETPGARYTRTAVMFLVVAGHQGRASRRAPGAS
jgi:hypothetical protein